MKGLKVKIINKIILEFTYEVKIQNILQHKKYFYTL